MVAISLLDWTVLSAEGFLFMQNSVKISQQSLQTRRLPCWGEGIQRDKSCDLHMTQPDSHTYLQIRSEQSPRDGDAATLVTEDPSADPTVVSAYKEAELHITL